MLDKYLTSLSSVKKSPVQEGGTVELNCNVDGPFEWCTFRRHDGKVCDFEWKRKSWLVEVVDCKDFKGRFAITGISERWCHGNFPSSQL